MFELWFDDHVEIPIGRTILECAELAKAKGALLLMRLGPVTLVGGDTRDPTVGAMTIGDWRTSASTETPVSRPSPIAEP